jgi:hypothetical protein
MDDETSGWRADMLNDLPQARIQSKFYTFPDAYDLIKVAAYNRRMKVEDFVGRSALAVAVFDSAGEHTWREMTRQEPPMWDLRRHNLPLKRKFGADFGPWEVQVMT